MMWQPVFVVIGAAIVGALGTMHLLYTFFSRKFDPYDRQVITAMQNTNPRLTQETTIWRCWIGFNASHSLGALLLAAMYIPLALAHDELLRNSVYFNWLPVVWCGAYGVLAYRYWFKAPLIGLLLAGACFIAAAVVGAP